MTQKTFAAQRGTVLLSCLFLVMLLVAALWMLIGVGETLRAREKMQDAADAAAFTSAVFHAKGMNLVAFINVLMALLIAILIIIRLAQSVLVISALILSAAMFTPGGYALSVAANQARVGAVKLGKAYKATKKVVFPTIESLHRVQEATSVVVPWVAMADGMAQAAQHHKPAQGAFAIPSAASLPISADKFPVLCGKGLQFVADGIFLAPGINKLPNFVKRGVGDMAEEMGKLASGFLCGSGKGQAPTYRHEIDKRYPRPAGYDSCEEDPLSSACQHAEQDVRRSLPGQLTGECQQHCAYDEPYEALARAARTACEPKPGTRFKEFVWQERAVTTKWRYERGDWQEVRRDLSAPILKKEDEPPCGQGGTVSDEEYQLDSGPRTQPEPTPLCLSKAEFPRTRTRGGMEYTTRQKAVTRLFSCVRKETHHQELAREEDALGKEGSQRRSPHKVEDDVRLGDEVFQIRAVAFGPKPGPSNMASKGAELIAREGAEASDQGAYSDAGDAARELANQVSRNAGRLAVAQAEYYFDGSEEKADWLWSLGWTARLKRFRLPQPEAQQAEQERQQKGHESTARKAKEFGGNEKPPTGEDACNKSGASGCGKLGQAMETLSSFVKH